ncbi:eEF1A lysine and N-terminal methyltransferase-like [Ruditapes philippinarum]|uniref:eEF1A lysine and N-terminal methyltransferase-like n=1 Tax=Ruditapes philippinarum TaxID=129788 RepID=UPI00295B1C84|nr:eEF1A lysine and N-terminal methyltransferase-like [Ruditapes philippinarum]
MNLLPKNYNEFVKAEYWEEFFKKRGAKAFEWYGEYPELCGVLHKYIKPQDNMLMVGCGNSQLSADLYDVGYHNIVNIDISDTVIRQMVDKNQQQRPDMKFLKMDVLNMEFADNEFTVALDKGTLDALMVDSSEKVVHDVEQMFNEIDRVLKLMGRYICISLLQQHILDKVIQFFSEKGWAVRIHRIHTEESGNSDKDFHMPVFALIFTKFKKNPKLPKILEVFSQQDKNERLGSVEDVINLVKEMQYFAVIRQRISKRKVTEEQLSLTLYGDMETTPRYTLTIVDSTNKLTNKFAIFIVPQGRETEWMFATNAGRIQLSESAGFERLVVVTLHRNHTYTDIDAIQAELSTKVMELAPPTFKHGTKVPFLSVGNSIGWRKVFKSGHSEISGDYVVEEVQGDGNVIYRRLVFLSNQNVVQSEAKLKPVSQKKKNKGKQLSNVVDKSYLACQHHVAMVAGLACVQCDDFSSLLVSGLSVLLVGLGGGGLPTYIHTYYPEIEIDVVDIDPEIVTLATEWFGFVPDDKLKAHVDDGLVYIQTEKEKGRRRYVIMLDVNGSDVSVGMSCPPEPFVDENFLHCIKDSLFNGGVFILNLVCRDDMLKTQVKQRIEKVFDVVFCHQIEDEVNEVIYALSVDNSSVESSKLKSAWEKNCQVLDKLARRGSVKADIDLVKEIENINIL